MAWRPHPGKQEEYCSRGEFEALFGGAAGGGKSDALVALATRFVGHPQFRGLLLRRTFPQLQEIIDRCWQQYPDLGGVYRSTEHRWYFPSGAMINLGHMQHEDDKYNYQGKQFHFIGFDELTQFTESQYLYLFSRARGVDPNIPTLIRATTNPGGIGHVWVKNRFVDVASPGQPFVDRGTGLSRVFIPALVYDNPTLCDADPGYIARLEALPDIEKRRLLHGDWAIFEGQVFPELSATVHGCQPFDVPPEWERYMLFDWGYSRPFACLWFAVDYDGIIWLYREWYGTNGETKDGMDVGLRMTARDVAVQVNKIELEARDKIRQRIADPAIFNRTADQRRPESYSPSIAEDFMAEGIFFQKADNDRLQGVQQVHKRLQLEEFIDKNTGEVTEESRFFAFNDCKHFWRTMQALQNDPRHPDDVESKYQDDHIYDCLRYMCMARPVRPKKVDLIPSGSFAAERNRLIRAKRYATKHGISLSAAYQRTR